MPNLSFVLYFHLISAIILILVASVFIPNQGQIDGYRGQVALLQKPLDLNTLLVLLSILQSTLLASAASSHSATLPTQEEQGISLAQLDSARLWFFTSLKLIGQAFRSRNFSLSTILIPFLTILISFLIATDSFWMQITVFSEKALFPGQSQVWVRDSGNISYLNAEAEAGREFIVAGYGIGDIYLFHDEAGMKVLNKTTALIKCDQSYGCNATIPFYTDYITDCVEETRPYDENAAKPTVFTNLYYKYSDGNPENKYIFDSKTQDSNIVVQVVWTVVKFGNGSSTSTVCTISPTFSNRSESSYTGTLSKTIIPDSIPPIKSTNQMKSLNDTRISSSVYTVGLLGVSLNRFINPSNLNGRDENIFDNCTLEETRSLISCPTIPLLHSLRNTLNATKPSSQSQTREEMEAVIERIHIRLASLNSWRRLDCRNCVYREYTWVKKSVLLVIVGLVNFLTIGLVGICLYLYKLKGLRLVDNNSENLFKRAVESNGGFKAWMNEGEFVVKGEIEKERDGISDEKC